MDTAGLETEDGRLEESLGSAEALVANGDDLTIGKLVRLLEGRALASGLELLLEVEGDVAELLLDVTNDFTLGGGGEGVTALSKNLHEVVGQVTTSHVHTRDGLGKGETLVDGDQVSNTVTRVEDDTGGTTGSVQRQDGLNGDVEGRGVEGLEDDLGHLLTVGLGVDGSLSQEDGVLLGSHTQLVVEGVVPNLLHVVPVGDDTVLDGVPQGEDTTLRLCLISDVRILLAHTNHDTAVYVSGRCDAGHADRWTYPWWRGRPTMEAATKSTSHSHCGSAAVTSWARPKGAITASSAGGGGDLRKTARGASSPAKPALHIPELGNRSA